MVNVCEKFANICNTSGHVCSPDRQYNTGMSQPTDPILHGEQVVLKPITEADLPRIHEILQEPAVYAWWNRYDMARTRQDFLDEETGFTINFENQVIGAIMYYEENDEYYRHAGMDIMMHPAWHGRHLGPDALRTVAHYLFDQKGHHRLIIDPAAANKRAIAAYTRIGFKPVGIMRGYEKGLNGEWHDGLLMDMLKDELI